MCDGGFSKICVTQREERRAGGVGSWGPTLLVRWRGHVLSLLLVGLVERWVGKVFWAG